MHVILNFLVSGIVLKKETFHKQNQFYFRFANVLNENIFVFYKIYFRFGNTFTLVCKLKSFVSKTKTILLSFRKCFLNKNIFL